MISNEHIKTLAKVYAKAINKSNFPRGVFTVDMDNIITAVNPKLLSLLGYKEEELVSHHATIIIPPPYVYYSPDGKEMSADFWDTGFAATIRYITKRDGQPLLVSFSGYAIKKDGKQVGIHFEASSLEELPFLTHPMEDILKKTEDFTKSLRTMLEPFRKGLPHSFTPTERKIVEYIKLGLATKEIAAQMGVATKTVETHRKSIREKLNLKPRQPIFGALSQFRSDV